MYQAAARQMINMYKSEVSYDPSAGNQPFRESIIFKAVETHDRYLHLLTFIGRYKKTVSKVQDRVCNLKGWKEKFLSNAGKGVLLKVVVQAIPTYAMQYFDSPLSMCNELEKRCHGFLWGAIQTRRVLLGWDGISCARPNNGVASGLGDSRISTMPS